MGGPPFSSHSLFNYLFQAKASKDSLKEVTHKVYFDIEIGGKPAGMHVTVHAL